MFSDGNLFAESRLTAGSEKPSNTVVTMKMCKSSEVIHRHANVSSTITALIAITAGVSLQAQPISVSNHSFESQLVSPVFFVDSRIDNWQKTPQPIWFTPTAQLTWEGTVGMFIGTPPFNSTPYSNLQGNQSAYMLSLPEVGFFQDNVSVDWNGTVGGLNATFQSGNAYQFTLGVFGKNLIEGFSSMQLSLYYRSGTDMITVGTPTVVTFSTNTFNPNGPYSLVDYSVTTPVVQPGDAWAGQNIGIRIDALPNAIPDAEFRYWDLDNVRLTAVVPEPTTLGLVAIGLTGFLMTRKRAGRQS